MVSNPISQAVVLATATAPFGARTRPLALVKTGGISQLRRTLLLLRREGVRRFVVVTGAASAAIRQHVANDPQLRALDIVWIRDAAASAEPGASSDHVAQGQGLLRARAQIRGDFYLVSLDRVFSPQVLHALLREPLDGVTLAVDRAPARAPAGALPVRCIAASASRDARGALVRFGDAASDTVFVGVASADRRLLDTLHEMRQRGERPDLQAALVELSERGLVRVAEIRDGGWWQPVRDEAERRHAQRRLVAALRKSVDGIIARHINRRFSLAMTRVLMHLPVRPNHVTAFSLLLSISAAVAAAFATAAAPAMLLLGAVLWQLASMIDGVDGELARLKYTESKIGEWFDTITDDIGRLTFFVGFGVGVANVTGNSIWLQLSLMSVAIQLAMTIAVYRKLIKTGSGSHFALSWELDPSTTTITERVLRKIEFMARRDYYVFALMVLVAIGLHTVAVAITFATTCVSLGHELFRPRNVREDFAVEPASISPRNR